MCKSFCKIMKYKGKMDKKQLYNIQLAVFLNSLLFLNPTATEKNKCVIVYTIYTMGDD